MERDSIWADDGSAYQKDGFIYSYREAAKRGFVSKEEAESHYEDKDG